MNSVFKLTNAFVKHAPDYRQKAMQTCAAQPKQIPTVQRAAGEVM